MRVYCPACEAANPQSSVICSLCGYELERLRSKRSKGTRVLGEDLLRKLIDIADKKHLAEVTYSMDSPDSGAQVRIVEPYSWTKGKQDVMVRCYQREPDEGWRFLTVHRLASVKDTGKRFHPRARIAIPDTKVARHLEESPVWTPALRAYRFLIGDALADGMVTAKKLTTIAEFKHKNRITMDQTRFVHGVIFHQCLGAILEDGTIDEDERAQIRFLHKVLRRLGWTCGFKA